MLLIRHSNCESPAVGSVLFLADPSWGLALEWLPASDCECPQNRPSLLSGVLCLQEAAAGPVRADPVLQPGFFLVLPCASLPFFLPSAPACIRGAWSLRVQMAWEQGRT